MFPLGGQRRFCPGHLASRPRLHSVLLHLACLLHGGAESGGLVSIAAIAVIVIAVAITAGAVSRLQDRGDGEPQALSVDAPPPRQTVALALTNPG